MVKKNPQANLGIRTARKLHIGQQMNSDRVLLRFDEFCEDLNQMPSIQRNNNS